MFNNKKVINKKNQQELYENAKICYICKENIKDKHAKGKKYHKFGDHSHFTGE